jgi:tRNA-splicing ligase RtcB
MLSKEIELKQITKNLWEIPKQGGMIVPGRVYLSSEMLNSTKYDEAIKQLMNVAYLPGIQKYSLAMPDIHWGYGFPIGGIAAIDYETGVVSPGGVGYDINCGVRLAATNLSIKEIRPKIPGLINSLYSNIPVGVGANSAIKKLDKSEIKKLLALGSKWAVNNDMGTDEDLKYTEEGGVFENCSSEFISEKAIERGLDQVGTLGAGNHFIEIGVVDEIYNTEAAEVLRLFPGQIVILIHTGSRGLGYQICEDSIRMLMKSINKFGINIPDKQLICAPIKSNEGQQYLTSMQCAANYAWVNRQVIMHLAMKSFLESLGLKKRDLDFYLIYDVCHNIAKIENHNIDGIEKKLLVHRKGATRAFSPNHISLPDKYKQIGQPVLVPGDMGTCSYITLGTSTAMKTAFGSSCHGAGRNLSRTKALEQSKGRNIVNELARSGILLKAKSNKTIAEEMPDAYKNISEIVDILAQENITIKVAKFKPVGVIKG